MEIAVEAVEHAFGNDTPIQQGIYLADVVYAGNHPTGVSNLRLLIESPGGL
jgi:hypothetical protein